MWDGERTVLANHRCADIERVREFMEWLNSLLERCIELDELRDEVDQSLTYLARHFDRQVVDDPVARVAGVDWSPQFTRRGRPLWE